MANNQQTKLKTSAMIASIAAEGQATEQAPFGNALNKVATTDERIVCLTADLAKYTDLLIICHVSYGQRGTHSICDNVCCFCDPTRL